MSGTDHVVGWLTDPVHAHWLRREVDRLLDFPQAVLAERGAALLDGRGVPHVGVSAPTFLTARTAHVFALAALRGRPGARPVAAALLATLEDGEAAGWPWHPAHPEEDGRGLYTLDFVVLAAATGSMLGLPGAGALLQRALARLESAFLDPGTGLARDRAFADASRDDGYRGLNGNMHLVEALLAAGDATGDPRWGAAAVRIGRFVIEQAVEREWRICEHYDAHWVAHPEAHRDRPDDDFQPYGVTPGHGFEWARLLASAASLPGADGFLEGAVALFERAAADGWHADGRDGFVYTTDWSGAPVSRERRHWVTAEAVAAAAVLHRLTGEPRFAVDYERWLDHVAAVFLDRVDGSWHHELTPDLTPVPGDKPDLYHAVQAMLIPQLPVTTSVAAGVLAARA